MHERQQMQGEQIDDKGPNNVGPAVRSFDGFARDI
jgi:hypothetical protein